MPPIEKKSKTNTKNISKKRVIKDEFILTDGPGWFRRDGKWYTRDAEGKVIPYKVKPFKGKI